MQSCLFLRSNRYCYFPVFFHPFADRQSSVTAFHQRHHGLTISSYKEIKSRGTPWKYSSQNPLKVFEPLQPATQQGSPMVSHYTCSPQVRDEKLWKLLNSEFSQQISTNIFSTEVSVTVKCQTKLENVQQFSCSAVVFCFFLPCSFSLLGSYMLHGKKSTLLLHCKELFKRT